jgi:hypothetical protein
VYKVCVEVAVVVEPMTSVLVDVEVVDMTLMLVIVGENVVVGYVTVVVEDSVDVVVVELVVVVVVVVVDVSVVVDV